MAFRDDYDFDNLIDQGRNFVLEELGAQLAAWPEEICTCNDCVVDMATLALNSVLPHYSATLMGSLYQMGSVHEKEYVEKVQAAVKKAIARVSANPGHD